MSQRPKSSRADQTQRIDFDSVRPPTPRTLTLQVVHGENIGAIYIVDSDQTVIGRGAEADISVPDAALSREHACFWRQGDSLVVSDLGSLNGTYVEGERIDRPRKLRQGDRVTVGRVTLRFLSQDSAELRASQQMYDAAVRDHLTGLYNRAYLEERLKAEFAFALRHRTPLAALMMDLDHFKDINDQHGHPVGDAVLKQTAERLRGGLRAEDIAARYGGEEFVVVARGLDEQGARALAERMRAKVSSVRVPLPTGAGTVSATLSVGIAVFRAGASIRTPEELLTAADTALYQAKRAGRDRVALHVTPQGPTQRFED